MKEVLLMRKKYLRGDLYYANLGSGVGSEQRGYRPVLIIQNDIGNNHSPTIIIASITSRTGVKAKLPTHYFINTEGGLEAPSIVLLEQIRTIDKKRLDSYIGHLNYEHLKEIDKSIEISLGLKSIKGGIRENETN